MSARRFPDNTPGLHTIVLGPFDGADVVAGRIKAPWDLDLYEVNISHEANGSGADTIDLDVKDDGVSVLQAVHAATDAKKTTLNDVALKTTLLSNGKIAIVAGSAITVEGSTLVGTVSRIVVTLGVRRVG